MLRALISLNWLIRAGTFDFPKSKINCNSLMFKQFDRKLILNTFVFTHLAKFICHFRNRADLN
jgi:hypothetical protein